MAARNLPEYELLRPQRGDLGAAEDPDHRRPFEELEHVAFDPRPYPPTQKKRPHGQLQTLLLRPRSRTTLLAAALLAIGFSLIVILPPGDRAGRSLPGPGARSGWTAAAAPPPPDRAVALRAGGASGPDAPAGEESGLSPARPAPPPPPTADEDEAESAAQDAADQIEPGPALADEIAGVPAAGSNKDGGAEPPNVLAPDPLASVDAFDAPDLDDTEIPGTLDGNDDDDNVSSPEGALLETTPELEPTRTAGVTVDPAAKVVAHDEEAGNGSGETVTPEGAEQSGDAVETVEEAEDDGDAVDKAEEAEDDGDAVDKAEEAEDDGDAVEKAQDAEDDGDAVEKAKEANDDEDAAEETAGEQESDDAVETTEGVMKGEDAVKKPEGPERVDGAVEKAEGPEEGDSRTAGLEEENDTVEDTGDPPSRSLTGTAGGDPAVQVGGGGSADDAGENGGAGTENTVGGTQGPAEDADGVDVDEGSVPAANSGATVGQDSETPVSELDTATTAVGGTGGDRTRTVAGSGGVSGGRTAPIRTSPASARPGETETAETLGSAPESKAAAEALGPSAPPPDGGAPEIRGDEPANDDDDDAPAEDEAAAVGGDLSGAGRDAGAGRAPDDEGEENENAAGYSDS